MNDIASMVSIARDLVDEYDSLITKIKYVKENISRDVDKVGYVLRDLENIYRKTRDFIEKYNNIVLGEDIYSKYLVTYKNYLLLISIPYVTDLLYEVREGLEKNNDKYVNEINQFIKYFNSLKT